jgi:hypothetical protein
MTGIPDELLAINVRLKSMLGGLTNHDKIIINYKVMISDFRIVASMTQYKETSKIILMETKELINDVFQSKHNILRFLKTWDEDKVSESGTRIITDEYGIEEIVPDFHFSNITHITTLEKKNEWFNLIKEEVKAYSQLLKENGIPIELFPEEVQKNEEIIELIVNAEVGSKSIFTHHSKEPLKKLLLEDNLMNYIFSDKDYIQINVEKGAAAYFFKQLVDSKVCLNFNILLNIKKRIYNQGTVMTIDSTRSERSRFKKIGIINEIDTIITQMKAL